MSIIRLKFSEPAWYYQTENLRAVGGGWVVRWCWVYFQCQGVLLIWLIVGQGPSAPAVGADEGCLDIFTLIYFFSPLSPSLWETARYRLKYCLKGPLNQKQPTNQLRAVKSKTTNYQPLRGITIKLHNLAGFLEYFLTLTFFLYGTVKSLFFLTYSAA